jgi:asparagine synthase (glutamine-hydrolysing)
LVAGRYADETPYVQAMARHFPNLDLNLIRSDGLFYLDGVDRYFALAEAPFRNASNRPWIEAILCAAQQQGTRVLLDGAAGNLTISWDGRGLLPQLLRAGDVRRAWHEAGDWHTFAAQGVLPLLPGAMQSAVRRIRRWNDPAAWAKPYWRPYSPIRPAFAVEQRVDERAAAKGRTGYWRPSADTRPVRAAVLTASPNGGADITTGYRAWFGVDQRSPTGDLRLVEFCLSLPEEQYRRNGKSRWLLRRAMAQRLPAATRDNPLRGLQAADWFDRLLAARPAIVAEMERLQASELARHVLDLPRLHDLIERLAQPAGRPEQVIVDYRIVLERGLMVGRFLRWLETGA